MAGGRKQRTSFETHTAGTVCHVTQALLHYHQNNRWQNFGGLHHWQGFRWVDGLAAKDKFQTPYGARPHRAKRWMIHYSFSATRENDGIDQILNQLLGKETCFAPTLSALTKEGNKFQHFSYLFHAASSIFISLCSLYHLTTNIPELVKDFKFPYQCEISHSNNTL